MALIASSVLPPFSLAVIHAGRLSTPRPRPRGGGMVVFGALLFAASRCAQPRASSLFCKVALPQRCTPQRLLRRSAALRVWLGTLSPCRGFVCSGKPQKPKAARASLQFDPVIHFGSLFLQNTALLLGIDCALLDDD